MALLEQTPRAEAPAPKAKRPELSPEQRLERLEKIGKTLAGKRGEAIKARQASGIEEQWTQDREFYEGIDDANRSEAQNTGDTKPPYQATPKTETATASTLFPNITAPYCEAAAARIADMLLPTDDRNFALDPTPIPDLVGVSKGKYPQDMVRAAAEANPGNPEMAKKALAQATQDALKVIAEAKEKADRAQDRVDDWLTEAQWHAEVRKVIEDSSQVGSGVLKGPVPVKKRTVTLKEGLLAIVQKIIPGSRRISCWDLFPDGACGDSIHNGSHIFERDRITEKQLEDLKGVPGYIPEQIDACIAEGPQDVVAQATNPNWKPQKDDKKRFEIWYFHGQLDLEDLEATGWKYDESSAKPRMYAIVTMVNDRAIKAALNPLDTGDFPYDVIPWRKKAGMPWGDGVARQIRTPQRIVTAALRAMMVNAGRAAGPIVVWQQGAVVPADGQYTITPWKLLYIGEDAPDDVRKAVTVIEIPMYQAELERIIQIGLKLAEDVTGLPMILQGQQGKAPDTVGGMQLLNDNASSVLRRLARTFDDYITEPHIRRYYTWLLQYGEDREKGDYCINARGSSALVERSLQNQELAAVVQLSKDPVYGLDPKKSMKEWLKSRKLNPKSFEFDDAEWKAIVQKMKEGPSDPRLAVAQLRAQLEEKLAVLDQQFEAQERAKDRQLELIGKAFDQKLEAMRMTGDRVITLDKIKAALAETVMQLRQQKEFYVADAALSMRSENADRSVDLHKHKTDTAVAVRGQDSKKPPSEPHGQAEKGKAFAH